MPACIISVLEGLKGESAIYSPFEDAGAQALVEATEALEMGLVDLAVVVAVDTPNELANLLEIALLGYLRPKEIASYAAGALILARSGEGRGHNAPLLKDCRLKRVAQKDPEDPLAPGLGRTLAAAPLVLAVLGAMAPDLNLPSCLIGSTGHLFSFAVERP